MASVIGCNLLTVKCLAVSCRVAVLLLAASMISRPADAHPTPFSYVDLQLDDNGVGGSVVVHEFDAAHDIGVDPPELLRDAAFAAKFRDQVTRLMESRLAILIDGHVSPLTWIGFETLPERQSLRLTFRISSDRPASLRVRAVLFPYDPVHQTFINVYEDGALRHQAILDGGRQSADY